MNLELFSEIVFQMIPSAGLFAGVSSKVRRPNHSPRANTMDCGLGEEQPTEAWVSLWRHGWGEGAWDALLWFHGQSPDKGYGRTNAVGVLPQVEFVLDFSFHEDAFPGVKKGVINES